MASRVSPEEKVPDGDVETPADTARARSYAADRATVEPERAVPSRARRRSSTRRRSSVGLELLDSLRVVDVAADELEHGRDPTGEDEHHGSTFVDASEWLRDQRRASQRRLSATLGTQQQQNRVGGTTLRREFDEFIERLHRDGAREPADVERLMHDWHRETFGREADPLARLQMYEEFLRSVLPTFIAGHVETTKSAKFWGAVVTALTVLLTWGDTVSDWVTLEQLLR